MNRKRTTAATPPANVEDLFRRVVAILDQARDSVVRSVNSHMVLAYWHVGREMVQTLQGGEARAEYGKRLVADLSDRLTGRFGRGFSTTNLWYFRQFYLAYADRTPEIPHKPHGESAQARKLHKACGELSSEAAIRLKPDRALRDLSMAIEHPEQIKGFSPRLSWSHSTFSICRMANVCTSRISRRRSLASFRPSFSNLAKASRSYPGRSA